MTKFVATCIDCGVCVAMATNKKKVLKLAQKRHVPQAKSIAVHAPTGLDVFLPLCTLRATEV